MEALGIVPLNYTFWFCFLFVCDRFSGWPGDSPSCLDWVVNKTHRSTCLRLPSIWMTSVGNNVQMFLRTELSALCLLKHWSTEISPHPESISNLNGSIIMRREPPCTPISQSRKTSHSQHHPASASHWAWHVGAGTVCGALMKISYCEWVWASL